MKLQRLVPCLAVLVALLFCLPSRSDLYVHRSAASHATKWAAIWDKVPQRFHQADVDLVEYNAPIPGFDSNVLGLFEPAHPADADGQAVDADPGLFRSRISLSAEGKGMAFVVAHELGHHIHDQWTPAEAKLWHDVYVAHLDELPTAYAHANEWEGFAECWQTLWQHKQLAPVFRQAVKDVTGSTPLKDQFQLFPVTRSGFRSCKLTGS